MPKVISILCTLEKKERKGVDFFKRTVSLIILFYGCIAYGSKQCEKNFYYNFATSIGSSLIVKETWKKVTWYKKAFVM